MNEAEKRYLKQMHKLRLEHRTKGVLKNTLQARPKYIHRSFPKDYKELLKLYP